jgi:hypothetical protein
LNEKKKSLTTFAKTMHKTTYPPYRPWSDPYYENGLGFGMGSTDGLVNRYQGNHRPESQKAERDLFSLRNFNDAYACHFDPLYEKHETLPATCNNSDHNQQQQQRTAKFIKNILVVAALIALAFFFFQSGLR